MTRRQALKRLGIVGGLFLAGYLGLEYAGSLYKPPPTYDQQLRSQITDENTDRIAYAVNYLAQLNGKDAVPVETVSTVSDYWKSLDSGTKGLVGGQIPTATACVLTDELLNSSTQSYVKQYPRLAFVHAHTNALFAMEPMMNIVANDPRLVALAGAKYSSGRVSPDLSYGEVSPHSRGLVDKAQFVRSGFLYWASNLGNKLNSTDPSTLAATVNQSMAGDVTDQLGTIQYQKTGSKELLWFESYEWTPFPTYYAFSAGDSSYGDATMQFGLNTMNQMWNRMPDSIKYNWKDGKMVTRFASDAGLVVSLDNWLTQNYGKGNSTVGAPEFECALYKKLYASQGLPAFTFEALIPGQLGDKSYPISSPFVVGSDRNNGISTADSVPFSSNSNYLIDLEQTAKNLESYVGILQANDLRVYLPHLWHTGNLSKLPWRRTQ